MHSLQSIPALLASSFWMPQGVSTVSPEIDWLFYFIFYICVFFFFLILGLLVVFSWKYRYRPGYTQASAPKHSTALELTWTFIPTVIVILIFYYGFKQYLDLAVAPPNPYEVIVDARTWSYAFEYPNGYIDTTLHVPSNTAVQMILTSEDVIHGFYIPQFRVKKDIVPGRYNKVWFQCDTPGDYDLFCTQYCGQGHSTMRANVVVQTPADFQAWLKKATDAANNGPPAFLGERLYRTKGCSQCHSIDGTRIIGPTWKNLWGYNVDFENGVPSLTADETFIRSCILTPSARIVRSYQNVMPSFQGSVNDKDINNIIAFMKTLSDKYHPEPTTKPATAPSAATATSSPATMPATQ